MKAINLSRNHIGFLICNRDILWDSIKPAD
jgi:hypothetical protein